MREPKIIQYCVDRDGEVCGICKQSISDELTKYFEHIRFAMEIKKQKRELQRKQNEHRKTVGINIDHILPHSWGGASAKENYQITHIRCNTIKGSSISQKEIEEKLSNYPLSPEKIIGHN